MRKCTGEILIRELGLLPQLSGVFSTHKSIVVLFLWKKLN